MAKATQNYKEPDRIPEEFTTIHLTTIPRGGGAGAKVEQLAVKRLRQAFRQARVPLDRVMDGVTLELTQEEAQTLRDLLGACGGSVPEAFGRTDGMYGAMSALLDRSRQNEYATLSAKPQVCG